jgi:glutamine cyclotransferase
MNPTTYTIHRTIHVLGQDGKEISMLNELEWINGEIWANIWQQHFIVRIDPESGAVLYWINLSGIEDEDETGRYWGKGNVLNGIAYYDDRIFVTGKRWHKIYEIKLYTTQLLSHSP